MRRFRIAVALCLVTGLALSLGAAPAPLKVTEFGRGPTIVLLHGLGSGRMTWMPTAKKLLATHHVVMMDLPGHGDSPLPDPFSLAAAAEAIAQSLAAQKADSLVVVGQGAAGMLALMAASAHPEQMRGVVVIDAALKTEQPIPDQMQRYFLQSLDANYDDILKGMFTRMGRDSTQGLALHAQATRVPPATIKAYIRELLNADGTKAVKGLKTPVLFIGTEKRWPADKDWPTMAKQLGYDGADGVAAQRIGNCGPLVASEQPDSLAAVLTQFEARALAKK